MNYKLLKLHSEEHIRNAINRNINVDIRKILHLYDSKIKLEFQSSQSSNHKLKQQLSEIKHSLALESSFLPNTTHPLTPQNTPTTIRSFFTPSTLENPLDHIQLTKLHNMLETEQAGKISTSSFYYLSNSAALLELALIKYAYDLCLKYDYTPINTPDVIRYDIVKACGYNPRTNDPQTYFVSSKTDNHPDNLNLCLSATAEFPLAALYSNKVIPKLPLKMVGFGRAFRAEGQAGAKNKGLYRVHQFSKVEMFGITDSSNDSSQQMLDDFINLQQEIFSGLELSFRVLEMPMDELGASAHRKIDIEAWMPGRKQWGEISSASNCTDFQSQRLKIRYFDKKNKMAFPHTVNATAAAIPRLIIAILETHQDKNGDIYIPVKLRPYFSGIKKIQQGMSLGEMIRASLDSHE